MGVNMKCENWHSDPTLVALSLSAFDLELELEYSKGCTLY